MHTHLGGSTIEAEENCAEMAITELTDYLENGNITNSVNFPDCSMDRYPGTDRIVVLNKNIPNMIGKISTGLASTTSILSGWSISQKETMPAI